MPLSSSCRSLAIRCSTVPSPAPVSNEPNAVGKLLGMAGLTCPYGLGAAGWPNEKESAGAPKAPAPDAGRCRGAPISSNDTAGGPAWLLPRGDLGLPHGRRMP